MVGDIKVEISLRHQSNSLLRTPTSGPSHPPSFPSPLSVSQTVIHSLTLRAADYSRAPSGRDENNVRRKDD